MYRHRISPASTVSLNSAALALWKDVLIAQTVPAALSVPVIFAGNGSKAELDAVDLKGKAVAIQASTEGLNLAVSLPERRYPGYVLNKFRAELEARGALTLSLLPIRWANAVGVR
jgi:ABC-type amino acid transport substrate-binding protein